jgi:hypothetical protein
MKEVKVCAMQTKPEIQKFLSYIFVFLFFFTLLKYAAYVVNAAYEHDERFSNVYTIIIRCSNNRHLF